MENMRKSKTNLLKNMAYQNHMIFSKKIAYEKNNKDFLIGIKTKDRILQAVWRNDNLPDNNFSILLKVGALSSDTGVIYLSYEYKNFSSITEEMKKLAEDAL